MGARVVLAACIGLVLGAAEWAPLPPSVWELKEDPARGLKGAVVLESRMSFTGRAILHSARIRILSEAGRDAAEFDDFLPEAYDVEGRTVQRDGKVVPFEGRKDFKVKAIKGTEDRKVLIPPGVTSDCVVELRWSDYATVGEGNLPPSLGYSGEWLIGGRYPILEQTIEFWPGYHWNGLVLPGRTTAPEVSPDRRKYVFRNLPGREVPPYALRSLAGLPSVLAWRQPDLLLTASRGDSVRYWQAAVDTFWKPSYHDNVKKGRAFKAFATELTADLGPDPARAAALLLRRLDKRIRNVSLPTLAELSSLDIKAITGEAYDEARDLDRIIQRGAATGHQMGILCIALLEHAGLKPQLAFVKSRGRNLFLFDLPNVFQATNLLVGVPVANGEVLWMDPAMRYATPGLIHPTFQGWAALVVDTATWKASRGHIPIQPHTFNVASYKVTHTFGEGERSFTLKGEFSGLPEYLERLRFMSLSAAEQTRTLKESLEGSVPDCAIGSAQVLNATDPDRNVSITATGTLECPPGDTLTFDPFPGVPTPLYLPTAWPETRTERIILDHLGIHLATCEFTVPKGYALKAGQASQHQNAFGRVIFLVETKDTGDGLQAKAVLRVDLLQPTAAPEAYADFRTFMGWVDEACRRQIVLEKR